MQRRTGLLAIFENDPLFQRLLDDGAEKTSRHQTAVRSEAAATPNAGDDNLNQLKNIELRKKCLKKLYCATSMKLISSLDSFLVSGTDCSFVIGTLVSTLIEIEPIDNQ